MKTKFFFKDHGGIIRLLIAFVNMIFGCVVFLKPCVTKFGLIKKQRADIYELLMSSGLIHDKSLQRMGKSCGAVVETRIDGFPCRGHPCVVG